MEALTNKYKTRGEFVFKTEEVLSKKCNAPTDKGGIYIVYNAATHEIIYIGSSGWVCQDGSFQLRKGGMCDRIVNGKQFDAPRKKAWASKMMVEGIKEIIVKWYVTFEAGEVEDIPAYAEAYCLQDYFRQHKGLPRWNTDF
ncbi:MAG: hypothetical protein J5I50_10440 [Chitinophagaceae bacterium]|nr:hypothetical protein [Chitinophagaceae bacterium]